MNGVAPSDARNIGISGYTIYVPISVKKLTRLKARLLLWLNTIIAMALTSFITGPLPAGATLGGSISSQLDSAVYGTLKSVGSSVYKTGTQVANIVTAIEAGSDTCYALKSDGNIWAWGDNSFGQFGNDSTIGSNVPVQVYGLSGITAISGGGNSGYALKSDGTI